MEMAAFALLTQVIRWHNGNILHQLSCFSFILYLHFLASENLLGSLCLLMGYDTTKSWPGPIVLLVSLQVLPNTNYTINFFFWGLILLKGGVYKCPVGSPRRYKKLRKEFLQLFSVPQGIAFERTCCCVWTLKEKCILDSLASTYMYDGLGLEGNRRKSHGSKRSQRFATAKDSCSECPKSATPKSHPTLRTVDTTKFISSLSTEQIRHAQ